MQIALTQRMPSINASKAREKNSRCVINILNEIDLRRPPICAHVAKLKDVVAVVCFNHIMNTSGCRIPTPAG
eukprot:scaffold300417_cov20-Prasinocladus_malaysianus.AAC.1